MFEPPQHVTCHMSCFTCHMSHVTYHIFLTKCLSQLLEGLVFSDILRFVLIAWVISRIQFSNIVISKLAMTAIMGTLLTLAFSYYSGEGELRELHSVGHINHTAIFLVIAYSISLSMLFFNFKKLHLLEKIFLFIASIILFSSTAASLKPLINSIFFRFSKLFNSMILSIFLVSISILRLILR